MSLWISAFSDVGYDALGYGMRCTRHGIRCIELWDTMHGNMGYGARYPQG